MLSVSQWCRNRRVGTKMLMIAAIAIAGTVITGAVGLVGIGDLRQTRTDEVGRAVPYITHLNSAALAAKAAANDERGYLIQGKTSFRDEAMGRQKTVNSNLAAARELAESASKTRIDAIKSATDAWFTAIDAEFTTFTTNPSAAITAAMGANRALRKTYEGLLDEEISRADAALLAGKSFDETVRNTRIVGLVVATIAVLLAIVTAVFVARLIVGPLRRVSDVLDAVAEGDLSHSPDVHQRDELGRMAEALRRATATLRQTVGELGTHAGSLDQAARALQQTSEHSAVSASAGARQAADVAESAGEMSVNIQTVAAGAEEMGAAIREISQSATQAVDVVSRAVDVTRTTTTAMARLGESSAEIGNVVKVITTIAEQTNLLALNATIEAARAGDAGKGFAVVATEVKDLAQETARATEDIGQRVAAIQADTAGAVAAIEEIGSIISQINDFQATIASAVEEQSATTSEMSRNVTEAAGGGSRVADTVAALAGSVQETTVGVTEATRAAGDLAVMSTDLRRLVDRFRL